MCNIGCAERQAASMHLVSRLLNHPLWPVSSW